MEGSERVRADERKTGPESACVSADDLKIGYGNKCVAQGIHFCLHSGEILAVIGPNGGGKSTLLKTVAGFQPPLGGTLNIDAVPSEKLSAQKRSRFLSVVMTARPDVEWMRVWDVAAAGRYPYTGRLGILSPEDKEIVEESLEQMQAADLKDRVFSELSDGQKQRVMLAKSIAQKPKLLILDEPTSFLDIRYILEFLQIAKDLAKRNKMAILMSLHELSAVREAADRVLTLKDGRQDRIGATDEILTEEYIRALYGIPGNIPFIPGIGAGGTT